MNIIPTIKYAWLTIKHKAFVFRAGLRTRAPLWRLVIHDWSKFTPSELPHYGRQFFGKKDDPSGFAAAWLHHQNHNPHHWEYWLTRSGHTKANDTAGDGRYVIRGTGDGGQMWLYDTFKEVEVGEWVHDDLGGPNWIAMRTEQRRLNAQPQPMPMPPWAVREMIADWIGASRAYEGHWPDLRDWTWLNANRPKMILHPDTVKVLNFVLTSLADGGQEGAA